LTGASKIGNTSDGSDLLIAGTLSYESDRVALWQIWQEWNSSRTYADRTARLAAGTGGLPNLDSTTVGDDGAAHKLLGGAGLDWFFASLPQDVLVDRQSGERLG